MILLWLKALQRKEKFFEYQIRVFDVPIRGFGIPRVKMLVAIMVRNMRERLHFFLPAALAILTVTGCNDRLFSQYVPSPGEASETYVVNLES